MPQYRYTPVETAPGGRLNAIFVGNTSLNEQFEEILGISSTRGVLQTQLSLIEMKQSIVDSSNIAKEQTKARLR